MATQPDNIPLTSARQVSGPTMPSAAIGWRPGTRARAGLRSEDAVDEHRRGLPVGLVAPGELELDALDSLVAATSRDLDDNCAPGLRSDDAVDGNTAVRLERPDGGVGLRTEVAVGREFYGSRGVASRSVSARAAGG